MSLPYTYDSGVKKQGPDLFAVCSLATFYWCVLRQVTSSPLPLSLPDTTQRCSWEPGGPGFLFSQPEKPSAHSDLTDNLIPPLSFSSLPHPAESTFSRRVEGKAQNHFEETNSSSQNSSGECACDVTSHVTSEGQALWGLLVHGGRGAEQWNQRRWSLWRAESLCVHGYSSAAEL